MEFAQDEDGTNKKILFALAKKKLTLDLSLANPNKLLHRGRMYYKEMACRIPKFFLKAEKYLFATFGPIFIFTLLYAFIG